MKTSIGGGAASSNATLCDLLEQQSFAMADPVLENIARLRNGAATVVTGPGARPDPNFTVMTRPS